MGRFWGLSWLAKSVVVAKARLVSGDLKCLDTSETSRDYVRIVRKPFISLKEPVQLEPKASFGPSLFAMALCGTAEWLGFGARNPGARNLYISEEGPYRPGRGYGFTCSEAFPEVDLSATFWARVRLFQFGWDCHSVSAWTTQLMDMFHSVLIFLCLRHIFWHSLASSKEGDLQTRTIHVSVQLYRWH